MAKRRLKIPIYFMVNEQEYEQIKLKMSQCGTRNMGAYLRKMAIDGYVIRLDLSDVNEMITLLRRSSNNLNQYARRAHQTGRIYQTDIEYLQNRCEQPWEKAGQILTRLASIR